VGKYLVVANQTLGGDQLLSEVRQRAAEGPSSFYVVVPNTASIDVVPALGGPVPPGSAGVALEGDRRATQQAEARLRLTLSKLRSEGVQADGELGDPEPLTAIEQALASQAFDAIIISTLPGGISRWLGMDLPSRAERKFKLPVTTITARA
jgi:hypothetical protein